MPLNTPQKRLKNALKRPKNASESAASALKKRNGPELFIVKHGTEVEVRKGTSQRRLHCVCQRFHLEPRGLRPMLSIDKGEVAGYESKAEPRGLRPVFSPDERQSKRGPGDLSLFPDSSFGSGATGCARGSPARS